MGQHVGFQVYSFVTVSIASSCCIEYACNSSMMDPIPVTVVEARNAASGKKQSSKHKKKKKKKEKGEKGASKLLVPRIYNSVAYVNHPRIVRCLDQR